MKFDSQYLERLYEFDPYSLNNEEKLSLFLPAINELTKNHYENCNEYRNILESLAVKFKEASNLHDVPYMPVRLFKQINFVSIPKDQVFKTMSSSGTTGQLTSKIYLDRETANVQTRVLSKIVSANFGSKRHPMVILDSESTVTDRTKFSARAAGILGFSTFASSKLFALDDQMHLRSDELKFFLEANAEKQVIFFGFTFIVWQQFLQALPMEDFRIDLPSGILIHGGGWKKLAEELKVSNDDFKKKVLELTGINRVHDYYGMVEQTGSLYFECESGYLHSSIFSHIVIRNSITLEPLPVNSVGIIEVVSVVGISYPGHAILTEDLGMVLGYDDCKCGKLGQYFRVIGRLDFAELRGCSDTFTVHS